MKNWLVSIFFISASSLPVSKQSSSAPPSSTAGNIIIITLDGFRWQELFMGADSLLLSDNNCTPGAEISNAMFGGSSSAIRREKLMPFFWNIIARKGQLYGNRQLNSKMNVANAYSISYPGYNEMFTGNTDMMIASNRKYNNPNINVLEWLDTKEEFKGKVAAFTSWDVFPFILNKKRNDLPINSGYAECESGEMLTKLQDNGVYDKKATRYDELTFVAAKEYLQQFKPRVLYLGLGETDEFAHDGRYDLYLQKANAADRMIAMLWQWVQTTEGYKDNTIFIITTDHGRGKKKGKWASHGSMIAGSSEVWMAVMGPGLEPLGEVKDGEQIYLQQVAQTIANLLGEEFIPGQPVADAITLPMKSKTSPGDEVLLATTIDK